MIDRIIQRLLETRYWKHNNCHVILCIFILFSADSNEAPRFVNFKSTIFEKEDINLGTAFYLYS